jgi:hypothetical protein
MGEPGLVFGRQFPYESRAFVLLRLQLATICTSLLALLGLPHFTFSDQQPSQNI